jgi:type VI secretion system protein ImpA
MASPQLLDFDALLAPIPGDNPAGEKVSPEVNDKLEKMRTEVNPEDLDPEDPTRAEVQAQKADWPGTLQLTERTLTERSKDLLIAAKLTEALVKLHGFAGLRDGLHLLRRMVAECWDRMYPLVEEEGDLEVRAGRFNWLDVADKKPYFPNTVKAVPLVFKDGQGFSLLDQKRQPAEFEEAIQATPRDECVTIADDLKQALEELGELTKLLDGKMGQAAPGMTGLRQVLGECHTAAQQILRLKPDDGAAPVRAGSVVPATRGNGQPPSTRPAPGTSREAIYAQLKQSAAVLRQLEPHSPIPYLIERAVELGKKPFPELIRALIREPNVLAELSREFGIEGAPAPEPASES